MCPVFKEVTRVKMFSNKTMKLLESNINEWIAEYGTYYEIIGVSISEARSHHTALVLYKKVVQ